MRAWCPPRRSPPCANWRASTSTAILEIERRTHHDVLAFTESVAEQVGEPARWFHYGLTSSDVVDTALALQLRDAGRPDRRGSSPQLERAMLMRAAEEFRHTPMMGRTHGMHAEPTTFGLKLLGWLDGARRAARLGCARLRTASRWASSPAPSARYAQCRPELESASARARPRRRAGRAPRSSRATATPTALPTLAFIGAFARAASRPRSGTCSAPRSARRRSRSRRPEGLELDAAQAQPDRLRAHLRPGPCAARQLGRRPRERGPLARARHLATPRPSASSSPTPTLALDYMLAPLHRLVDGLVVYPERMLENMETTHGLVFSQRVLLALVEEGHVAQAAYADRSGGRPGASAEERRLPRAHLKQEPSAARPQRGRLDALFDLTATCARRKCFERLAKDWGYHDNAPSSDLPNLCTRARCARSTTSARPLLMVATDRISAFDVVLPTAIPDKGARADRAVARSGSRRPRDVVPNHLISTDVDDVPRSPPDPATLAAGRCSSGGSRCCRSSAWCAATSPVRLEGLPGDRHGLRHRAAARACTGRPAPEPIFTPATKAAVAATTRTSTDEVLVELVGAEHRRARVARRSPRHLQARGGRTPRERGIIIADTKFEFGIDADGELDRWSTRC